MNGVISRHNAGFFSCCCVRLADIVRFINEHLQEPAFVDSSAQFEWYKRPRDKDITFTYFEPYLGKPPLLIRGRIDFNEWDHQFRQYSTGLDYERILPLVRKYFSPSLAIQDIVRGLESKYRLQYDNLCVLFYRGNDKRRETQVCEYAEYVQHAERVLAMQPNVTFLIQTDETEFLTFFRERYPHNSFYLKDEIRHMSRRDDTVDQVMRASNYEFSHFYLAITIVMSRCKYIICGTGNCSLWIMFYRGHANNVFQFRHGQWHVSL